MRIAVLLPEEAFKSYVDAGITPSEWVTRRMLAFLISGDPDNLEVVQKLTEDCGSDAEFWKRAAKLFPNTITVEIA